MISLGAIGSGLSLGGAVSSFFGGRKRRKAQRKAAEEAQKFLEWIMFAPYSHERKLEGFGESQDKLQGFNRKESFTFAPDLKKYIDTQGASLGNLPAFGDLQAQTDRLNAGDNIFDNLYDQARASEYERLQGLQGHDMFSRGLGQSTVFGNALGRLSRSHAEKKYADQAQAIADEQNFNARAQENIFGGLNTLYSYAQGLRGEADRLRGQFLGAAPATANAIQNTGLARANEAGQNANFLGSLLSNAGGAVSAGAFSGGAGGLGGIFGGVGNNTRINPQTGAVGGAPTQLPFNMFGGKPPMPKAGLSQGLATTLSSFAPKFGF